MADTDDGEVSESLLGPSPGTPLKGNMVKSRANSRFSQSSSGMGMKSLTPSAARTAPAPAPTTAVFSSPSPSSSLPPLKLPRLSFGKKFPFYFVLLLTLYLAASWTWLRIRDPRLEQVTLFSRAKLDSWRIHTSSLVIVWVSTLLLVWSLCQVYLKQNLNFVERKEQYIQQPDTDKKLEGLLQGASTVPASSATEDDLLFDLPDLYEMIPGFVCDLTESCTMLPTDVNSTTSPRPANPFNNPHLLLPTLTCKINGCRRYCNRCKCFKPDRSHHCYRCGRCVKKMDHHCIFLSSCIGFYNYKFFLLFLFYAFVACLTVCVDCYNNDFMEVFRGGVNIPGFLLAMTFTFCCSLSLALPIFLGFHIKLFLLNGMTTVEFNESGIKRETYLGVAQPDAYSPARVNNLALHPYKLSLFANFKQVFGFSIWKWLLPIPVYSAGQKILAPGAAGGVGGDAEPLKVSATGKVLKSPPATVGRGSEILRTAGRSMSNQQQSHDEIEMVPVGTDADLDELSAVPLLSALTLAGSPIASAVKGTSGVDAVSASTVVPSSTGPNQLSLKTREAIRELASWERTHQVPQALSQFERSWPHPIYDGPTELTNSLYTRPGKLALKFAAQGVLGKEERELMAEWQSKGLMFPTAPHVVHSQLLLWRESKLFKQSMA